MTAFTVCAGVSFKMRRQKFGQIINDWLQGHRCLAGASLWSWPSVHAIRATHKPEAPLHSASWARCFSRTLAGWPSLLVPMMKNDQHRNVERWLTWIKTNQHPLPLQVLHGMRDSARCVPFDRSLWQMIMGKALKAVITLASRILQSTEAWVACWSTDTGPRMGSAFRMSTS